jgi:conjugative transfer signal peptidase TraF
MANRRAVFIMTGFVAGLGLAFWGCQLAGQALAFNSTTSLPQGLYRRRPIPAAFHRGDLVSIAIPAALSDLLAAGDLGRGAPLLKKVVALPGDHVCTANGIYEAAGVAVGPVFERDSHGHPLPQHRVCGLVGPGLIYLGAPHPHSVDSRYFGPVGRESIRDAWSPLWTF